MTRIDELEQALRRAHGVSGQGSYERRAPTPAARIAFTEVRDSLRKLLSTEPDNYRALIALASAEEGLLNYSAAVLLLQRCLELCPSAERRRLLKQLARVKEYAGKWGMLRLSPEALATLGRYLDDELSSQPCDRSTRHTEAWLAANQKARVPDVLNAFGAWGGRCDCEVLANVSTSWSSETHGDEPRAEEGRAGADTPSNDSAEADG